MNQVSPSQQYDMSPTRTQVNSLHASPHLLPLPPPAFSRHSSHSDGSDASETNPALYDAQPGSGELSNQSALLPYSVQPTGTYGSHQQSPSDGSRQSRNSFVQSNDDGQNLGSGVDGDNSADFTQTFYDPFRIKHRRRTSPNQLKILEYHFEHNPKPDVTLRKALSEQLDMTPREVQVWFQNRRAKTKKLREKAEKEAGFLNAEESTLGGRPLLDNGFGAAPRSSLGGVDPQQQFGGRAEAPLPALPHLPPNMQAPGADYLALRRGSSPAVLSAGLVRPNGNAYYEPPPMHRGQNVYAPPRQSQQPSFYAAHPNLPSAPALTPANVYPSPMSVSASGLSTPSPNEQQHSPLEYLHQSPTSQNGEDNRGGRRFSLPAYNSNYAVVPGGESSMMQQQQPQQQQRFALPEQNFRATSYASPPLDVQSLLTEMNFASVEGYDAPREEGYSPPSSGEEPPADYGASSFLPPSNGQQPFPLSQYTFGGPSSTSFSPTPPFENLAQGGPPSIPAQGMYNHNERRASCPAGFIPTFDHLALSSPTTSAAQYPPVYDASPLALPQQLPIQQQPPMNLQRRHSLAPTSPSYISTSPSSGGFYNPQLHGSNARRGSTSAALGTIDEALAGGQLNDPSRSARRVRSQRELAGPYANIRRSPQPSSERRDSFSASGQAEWDGQQNQQGQVVDPFVMA